jgi:hypothetical protein
LLRATFTIGDIVIPAASHCVSSFEARSIFITGANVNVTDPQHRENKEQARGDPADCPFKSRTN